MNRLKRLVLAVIVSLSICLMPATVMAQDVLTGGIDCSQGNNSQSAVCQQQNKPNSKDNPLTGCPSNCGHGILYDATNIISIIAGGAALIVIIVGALRFVTSGSDVSTSSRTDTDIENARRTIGSALVGLVVIVLARTLIFFVLSKL